LLKEALASVVRQTVQDFEVVVVDAYGRGDAEAVVESFGDARIRYLRIDDVPIGAMRNAGVRSTTAELIAPLDDDDTWVPEKLEWQLAKFSKPAFPNLGLVYGSAYYLEEGGETRLVAARHRGDVRAALLTEKFYLVIGGYSNAMFRRQAFLDAGGFDERIHTREDYDLHLRISLAGYTFDYVERPTAVYRHYSRLSLTHRPRKRALGFLQIYRKHRKLFLSTRGSRHVHDLMLTSRFLLKANHPKFAEIIFRHAISHRPVGGLRADALREALATYGKIVTARVRAWRGTGGLGLKRFRHVASGPGGSPPSRLSAMD
jgi:glycosyltransferase involved in cell wall biosynthesis